MLFELLPLPVIILAYMLSGLLVLLGLMAMGVVLPLSLGGHSVGFRRVRDLSVKAGQTDFLKAN